MLLKYIFFITFSALLLLSTSVTAQTEQKSYGPVQNNEALWLIADQLRPDDSISIAQMAVALFNQNPNAFINNNINNLAIGVTLVIPDKMQLNQLSIREAESVFHQHWQIWQDSNALNVEASASTSSGDLAAKRSTKSPAPDKHAGKKPPVGVIDDIPVVEKKAPDFIVSQTVIPVQQTSGMSRQLLDSTAVNLTSVPVRLLLVVLLFFLVMIYFFRRQETDFLEINPDDLRTDVIPLLLNQVEKPPFDKTVSKTELPENKELSEQLFEAEKIDHSSDIVTEQVDVHKFLKANDDHKTGLLEKVFDDDIALNEINSAQANELPDDTIDTENILDSVVQIKFVQDSARHSKMEAFIKVTQPGTSLEQLFENDFISIRDNEKVHVFIEEMEQQILNLITHAQLIKKIPDELDNLIQFNSANHLIKVLSEMMGASHLSRFAQTIVEFLDDIIDGKSSLSVDVINRLAVVIDFYYQYSCSVKGHQAIKVEV